MDPFEYPGPVDAERVPVFIMTKPYSFYDGGDTEVP